MSKPKSIHASLLSAFVSALFGAITGLVLVALHLRPAYAIAPICPNCGKNNVSVQTAAIQATLPESAQGLPRQMAELTGISGEEFARNLNQNLSAQLAMFSPLGQLRAVSKEQAELMKKTPITDFDHLESPTLARAQADLLATPVMAAYGSPERMSQMIMANAFPEFFDAPSRLPMLDVLRLSERLTQL